MRALVAVLYEGGQGVARNDGVFYGVPRDDVQVETLLLLRSDINKEYGEANVTP